VRNAVGCSPEVPSPARTGCKQPVAPGSRACAGRGNISAQVPPPARTGCKQSVAPGSRACAGKGNISGQVPPPARTGCEQPVAPTSQARLRRLQPCHWIRRGVLSVAPSGLSMTRDTGSGGYRPRPNAAGPSGLEQWTDNPSALHGVRRGLRNKRDPGSHNAKGTADTCPTQAFA